MFPQVIINSLMFHLVIDHYLDQWVPKEVNRPLGTFWKSVDLLVVTIIWVGGEAFGGWGAIDPRSPNKYETTLYKKELSAFLKMFTLLDSQEVRCIAGGRLSMERGVEKGWTSTFPDFLHLIHSYTQPERTWRWPYVSLLCFKLIKMVPTVLPSK